MHNPPVHWSEGLFLQPHHLQAADRHWSEASHISEVWDHQYGYGIRKLDVSEEALSNFQFQVNACHARTKDGTLISLDAGQEPDRVDLKAPFADESVLTVYLAIPKRVLGRANVSNRGEAENHRFVENTLAVQDESFGGNEQAIPFRELHVQVKLSTDNLAGFELLPIARVQRAQDKEATPTLDPSYFPPMLAIDAWGPLGRDTVRAIFDVIGQRIEILSETIVNRNITLASQAPGDLNRLMMLSQLNAAYATLNVLTFASGVHPLTAYTELVRVVGQLSIFGPTRRPPEIPAYDHDDLARIFHWARRQIEMLLDSIVGYEYEQRFFVGEGRGMSVSLESKWLGSDWTWYVGVLRGELSEKDCLTLLSPGALNWKLGSSRQVEALFRYGQAGLELTPVTQAPRALPPNREWIYYEVSRGNAAWNDVMETQTLAMRLQDRLIVNLDDLQGKRSLVVAAGGKQFAFEFALFAVPTKP